MSKVDFLFSNALKKFPRVTRYGRKKLAINWLIDPKNERIGMGFMAKFLYFSGSTLESDILKLSLRVFLIHFSAT